MLAGSNLEVVDKFCYLGDMLDAGGGAESSTVTRVRSGWEKFRELLPLLTTKAISLKVKGSCMQHAFVVSCFMVVRLGRSKLKNLKGCTVMRCQ